MLDKETIERRIYNHLDAIRNLVLSYAPDDPYISMVITSNGAIFFSNTYWSLPPEQQINYFDGQDGY